MLFNLFGKRTVVVNLDDNTKLVVKPVTGGANAELTTISGERFMRTERAFFSSCGELVNSLRLTDEKIIGKLSKAF